MCFEKSAWVGLNYKYNNMHGAKVKIKNLLFAKIQILWKTYHVYILSNAL